MTSGIELKPQTGILMALDLQRAGGLSRNLKLDNN
jgi:hypothetical protein